MKYRQPAGKTGRAIFVRLYPVCHHPRPCCQCLWTMFVTFRPKISNRDPVLLKLTSVHPLKVIFALWSLILTYLPWATLVEAVAGSWHSNHCSITTRSISLWKYAALGWNNVKRLQPKVLVKVVIPMPAMLITEALSLTAQNIVLIPTTLIWSGSWTKWNNSWKSSENAFIDFK